MAENRRPLRVAEQVRGYLTQALLRDFSDPRLASVIVTDVVLTDDLALATVRIRTLSETDAPRQRASVLLQLKQASNRLKRGLGSSLGLRKVPELRFFFDEGLDKARRVEAILSEIAEEPRVPEDPLAAEEPSDD